MKKIILIFIFITITLFADTSIWKVSKGQSSIYIGGTIHLLRSSDYPLPKEFNDAYNLSDEVYLEADLQTFNKPEMIDVFTSKMLLKNGKRLLDLISKETYFLLEIYAVKYGMNLAKFSAYKPAMPVLIITVAELQNQGFTADGVDSYIEQKAIKDKKNIAYLETVEEQLNYISSFGSGNEESFVIQSLKDLEKINSLFPEIVTSWKRGDTKSLEQFFVDDMKKDYPKLYKTLLVERNNNWLPKIKNMFDSKKVEFVLVGTGHLVGDDGIIKQLKKDGYKVEKF